MAAWITQVVTSLGYFGVGLLMFLENIFPPIPSELIMPLAGFAASKGELSLVGVCVAGTVGATLGQLPIFLLGRWIGTDGIRLLIRRYGRWLLVREAELDRALGWFSRHGLVAVLVCRLVPGLRSLISVPAGLVRAPWIPFLFVSFVGISLWTTLLALVGYALGENYELVGRYVGPLTYWVGGALVVAVLAYFVRRGLRPLRPGGTVNGRSS